MRRMTLLFAGAAVVVAVVAVAVSAFLASGPSGVVLPSGASGATRRAAPVQARWVIRDLGTLGGKESYAVAMNERGQIVGTSEIRDYQSYVSGFLWDRGRMIDLGTLGAEEGTYPYAINSRGQVVGWSSRKGDRGQHAFLWEKGKMDDLGTLGGKESVAYDINERGQVVGESDTGGVDEYGFRIQHAFLWQTGKMRDLGNNDVIAINEHGQVLSSTALWGDGRWRPLGSLGGETSASDLNDRGQVVGSAEKGETNKLGPIEHAFLWQNGKMTDLGTLPGRQSSRAVAINDQGLVVGVSYTEAKDPDSTSEDLHTIFYRTGVFVWQNGKMRDLHVPLPGWADDSVPLGVNDHGQIVVVANGKPFVVQNGKIIYLPRLSKEDCYSVAQINEQAQIIGSCDFTEEHAVLWTLRNG